MISVYIAARSEDRERAKSISKLLTSSGFIVTSRWLKQGGLATHYNQLSKHDAFRLVATNDINDLKMSDILVAFLPWKFKSHGTGGRHFEFGVAYACNKPIVIVGDRSNVFHCLPGVDCIDSDSKLIDYLKSGVWKNQIKLRCL